MMNVSRCRACGAEISFIKTKAGKTMPVDCASQYFHPDPAGSQLYVLIDGTTCRGEQLPMGTIDPDQKIGFVSHFATCPEADKFRKPRKSDRKKG